MLDNEFCKVLKENITKEKVRNLYRTVGAFIMFALTNLAYPITLYIYGADGATIQLALNIYYITLYGAGVTTIGVVVATFLGENKGKEPMVNPDDILKKTVCPMYIEDKLTMVVEASKAIRDLLDDAITNGEAAKSILAKEPEVAPNSTSIPIPPEDTSNNPTQ